MREDRAGHWICRARQLIFAANEIFFGRSRFPPKAQNLQPHQTVSVAGSKPEPSKLNVPLRGIPVLRGNPAEKKSPRNFPHQQKLAIALVTNNPAADKTPNFFFICFLVMALPIRLVFSTTHARGFHLRLTMFEST